MTRNTFTPSVARSSYLFGSYGRVSMDLRHRIMTWLAGLSAVVFQAACGQHHIQALPSDVSNPVALQAATAYDAGDNASGRHADGDDDNLSDYIEIVGTAPQLMMLPSVGKLLISDHGQTPLAHGRWRVSGYAAVKDTPDVLAKIRALGMKATVPMSVTERKRRMQPSPRSSVEKWNVDWNRY